MGDHKVCVEYGQVKPGSRVLCDKGTLGHGYLQVLRVPRTTEQVQGTVGASGLD